MSGGFSTFDSLLNKITASGQSTTYDFTLNATANTAGTAGRYYDLNNGASTESGFPLLLNYNVATALTFTPITQGSIAGGDGIAISKLEGNVSPALRFLMNTQVYSPSSTVAPGVLILCDYLGCYGGNIVPSTGSQSFTNTLSLPRYTNGNGVMAFASVIGTFGAASPVMTFTYTDNNGSSKTSVHKPQANAIIAPTIIPNSVLSPYFAMSGTSYGVKSVQSVSVTSGTTGAYAVVLVKPLMSIAIPSQYQLSERDCIFQFPSLPQIQDGACLGFIYMAGAAVAANSALTGRLQWAWG